MAISSAVIGSISVAGAWASAEIITGVGVLSGIYLFSRPNSGRIRYSDGTGIDPETGEEVKNKQRAYEIYHNLKDKIEKMKWKRWMKGKGWIPTHFGR